jgi:hypothetical protein
MVACSHALGQSIMAAKHVAEGTHLIRGRPEVCARARERETGEQCPRTCP